MGLWSNVVLIVESACGSSECLVRAAPAPTAEVVFPELFTYSRTSSLSTNLTLTGGRGPAVSFFSAASSVVAIVNQKYLPCCDRVGQDVSNDDVEGTITDELTGRGGGQKVHALSLNGSFSGVLHR